MKNIYFSICIILALTACAQTPVKTNKSYDIHDLKDFAILHLYRPSQFSGSAITGKVSVNGEKQVKIGNGDHVELKVPVGDITVSVEKSNIELSTKAKEMYFIKVTPIFKLRLFGAQPFELVSISQDEAEQLLNK